MSISMSIFEWCPVQCTNLKCLWQVRSGGLQRELIWNRRAGLEPDSAILRNASTARIVVDAQGRRSVSMVGLAIPAGTATGDLQFR